MNCTECKELLVAHIEGLLDKSQQQAVAEHLKDCSACKAEAETLRGLQDRLASNGQALAQSDLENDVMNLIVREQKVRLKAAEKAAEAVGWGSAPPSGNGGPRPTLHIRRIIMKSRFAKVAAAAVIIIAVLIGLNPFGPTVTFADVVKPLLDARTLVLDIVVNIGGPAVDEDTDPVIHDTIVDKRIRRVISTQEHVVNIFDTENAKMLTLHTEGKVATYADIQGLVQDITQNYVVVLLDIITDVQNNPDFKVEELGEKDIDGQKVVGFLVRNLTVWADAETGLPVRIEHQEPGLSAVYKNFQFNVPVEELEPLVSMNVPDGYTLVESKGNEFDMGTPTEQDLVECLRFWAELLLDGNFPEAIGMTELTKLLPQVEAKLAESVASAEDGAQKGMTLGKGMLLHMTLKDKHYAGAGVKVGEADKAIFWYLPEGAGTYRVIYGDLSVKDVAEENLPK